MKHYSEDADGRCDECNKEIELPEENLPNDDDQTNNDSSVDDPSEYEHVCEGVSGLKKFWNAVVNFFRKLFGLPEKCPHGIEIK